jgi:hypothetical protein
MNTPTSSTTLKTYFETGDIPTESQFSDWLTSYSNLVDNNWLDSLEAAITAHAGGGQGSAYALTKLVSIITTCATNNDSVLLMPALAGRWMRLTNSGAATCAVYPQSGEAISNLGTNNAVYVPPSYTLIVFCNAAGAWTFQLFGAQGKRAQITNLQSSASSLTPDASIYDVYLFTAQAATLTINAPANVYTGSDEFSILIKDNGTAQTLTWNVAFAALSSPLPVLTIAGKYMFMRFKWNSATGLWYMINYSFEGQINNTVKIYRALISQSGTAAPTATVLENTLGVTPTFSRVGAGNYTLTATGVLTSGKMFASTQGALTGGFWASCNTLSSPNTLQIETFNNIGGGTDTKLNSTPIEILIYP